jgi:hypothetical protein
MNDESDLLASEWNVNDLDEIEKMINYLNGNHCDEIDGWMSPLQKSVKKVKPTFAKCHSIESTGSHHPTHDIPNIKPFSKSFISLLESERHQTSIAQVSSFNSHVTCDSTESRKPSQSNSSTLESYRSTSEEDLLFSSSFYSSKAFQDKIKIAEKMLEVELINFRQESLANLQTSLNLGKEIYIKNLKVEILDDWKKSKERENLLVHLEQLISARSKDIFGLSFSSEFSDVDSSIDREINHLLEGYKLHLVSELKKELHTVYQQNILQHITTVQSTSLKRERSSK